MDYILKVSSLHNYSVKSMISIGSSSVIGTAYLKRSLPISGRTSDAAQTPELI